MRSSHRIELPDGWVWLPQAWPCGVRRVADGTELARDPDSDLNCWILTDPDGSRSKLERVSKLIEGIAYVDETRPLPAKSAAASPERPLVKQLTVGELRAALARFEDGAPVWFDTAAPFRKYRPVSGRVRSRTLVAGGKEHLDCVLGFLESIPSPSPARPLGIGDRFYHRRADFFGRIDGWAERTEQGALVWVTYELPHDGTPCKVPFLELEPAGGAA